MSFDLFGINSNSIQMTYATGPILKYSQIELKVAFLDSLFSPDHEFPKFGVFSGFF